MANEITLTQILYLARDYFFHLLKYWWVILILGGLVGGLLYYQSSQIEDKYVANLRFILNTEGEGGPNIALGGIMGQFGMGASTGGSSMSKMAALLNTQQIIKSVLFSKEEISGKEDFLANHYIDKFNLHEVWKEQKKDKRLNFYFTDGDFESFDRFNTAIANTIFAKIAKHTKDGSLNAPHLVSVFDDTGSEMVELSFTSTNEEYSLVFTKRLFTVLSDYYIDNTVEKQRTTYELVKKRTDSLSRLLNYKKNALAEYKDRNSGIFRNKSFVNASELNRETNMLGIMVTESTRSLEQARMSLQTKTPFITSIDEPMYPLPMVKEDVRHSAMVGFAIGAALAMLLLGGWKVVTDLVEADKKKEALREEQRKSALAQ